MKAIATLNTILATNFALYVKTQNFHWNVQGSTFMMLHEMFGAQYENLAEANDEIAERIRALGALAPGSMKEFINLSLVKESANDMSAEKMLEILVLDHQTMIEKLSEAITAFADSGDDGTADLLTARIQYHQQQVWMLKSTLA